MSLSVKYSTKTEMKLREVVWEMMSEALSVEPADRSPTKVAEMVGEIVQLVALCKEYLAAGRKKRYDVHVYVGSSGVEWQYFQVES
ncbi:MAG: hypothetical protein KGH59_04310 [Candidatus Micrarchaeota archaeon]|nr:hypothetical protein [Candidatus Micrarchaeota archaeon]MDE1804975.1 hypothetical protein [Candidatus Micrarchaeota archaeon]MDE1847055.1 hypothetical protein [Candidatus Micrarchaeota archaeon]